MDSLAGHFRRYSRADVLRLFAASDLECISVLLFNPVGAVGWLLNAHLLKPKTLSDKHINRQILFFDRYLLPLSRKLTLIIKYCIGQSVMARVEKR
jgi:hypothetical protein